MNKVIYFLNNNFVEKDRAVIPVNDIGLLRAYAVFDYLKTYFSKPFHLNDHIDRLFKSAEYIGLKIPKTKSEIREIVLELISINKFVESSIRIIVTGGESPDGKKKGEPNLIITCEPRNEIDKTFYEKGVKIKTVRDYREAPIAKTINYTMAVKYLSEYFPQGYFEVLYVHNSKITECTSSNIFFIKGTKIITPKDEILPGITRKIIIDQASKFFDIDERDVYLHEIYDFEEAFITSTDKEVLPVISIDTHYFNKGIVGEKTRKIMKLFKSYVDSKIWFEN
ncbi:MAG: aminotransferase class IV [Ignavibacteria bacterium]|nr:aminotransferase class IV [Ignavibacteria bacterium]